MGFRIPKAVPVAVAATGVGAVGYSWNRLAPEYAPKPGEPEQPVFSKGTILGLGAGVAPIAVGVMRTNEWHAKGLPGGPRVNGLYAAGAAIIAFVAGNAIQKSQV